MNIPYVLLLFLLIGDSTSSGDWIDPLEGRRVNKEIIKYGRDPNKESNVEKYEKSSGNEFELDQMCSVFNQAKVKNLEVLDLPCKTYMTRFINLVLLGTGLQDYHMSPESTKRVSIEVTLSGTDLQLLKSFGEGGDVPFSLLDNILTKIYQSEYKEPELPQKSFDSVINFFAKKGDSIQPVIFAVIGVLASTFMLLLLKGNNNICSVFLIICGLVFFLSAGWNWIRLYKEEEIKQTVTMQKYKSELPIECRPWDMTFFGKLFLYRDDKNCEEYYKAMNIDPYILVKPEKVFTETFMSLFATPLRMVGSIIGDNVAGLTEHVALPFKWILDIIFPVATFISVVILIPILLMVFYGVKLNLNSLFGGFELSVGDNKPTNKPINRGFWSRLWSTENNAPSPQEIKYSGNDKRKKKKEEKNNLQSISPAPSTSVGSDCPVNSQSGCSFHPPPPSSGINMDPNSLLHLLQYTNKRLKPIAHRFGGIKKNKKVNISSM